MSKSYFRYITDKNGRTISCFDYDVSDILKAFDKSFTSYKKTFIGLLNIATTSDGVVLCQSFINRRQANLHGFQLIGIDCDLVFFQKTSPSIDFYYARNPSQLSSDHPVLNRPQIGNAVSIFISRLDIDDVLVDFAQTCRNRPHEWLSKSCWNSLFGYFDPLRNQLAWEVSAHFFFKNNGHHRQSKLGNRTDFFYARQVCHFQFDRISQKLLHILSCEIARGGDDLHLVVGHIRHSPDW